MTLLRFGFLALALSLLAGPAAAERPMAPSDPEAVRLARRALKALGGRDAWNDTRYLAWNFFGKRFHVWDTWTGDVRMDAHPDVTVLFNVETLEGRVRKGENELEGEEREQALQQAWSTWINDSYWVVMPYKLLDPGVRLRGPRELNLPDGRRTWSLHLTFDRVGRTHWNAYDVYLNPETHLVEGWAFYRNAADREPAFELPWHLERRGRLMLPVDHGRGGPWDVEVFDELPSSVFEQWSPRLDMGVLKSMAEPRPPSEPGR